MTERPEGPLYSARLAALTADETPCPNLCYCERAGLIAEVKRMREAKRMAGLIADERSKENVALRAALTEILMDGPICRAQRIAREALERGPPSLRDHDEQLALLRAAREQGAITPPKLIHIGLDGQPHDGERRNCALCGHKQGGMTE